MNDSEKELERRNKIQAERQRTYRDRMKARGFCLVQEWVPCPQKGTIKTIAKHLRDGGTIDLGEENA